MKPGFRWLGPEIIWFLAICIAWMISWINNQSDGRYNDLVENLTLAWPIIIYSMLYLSLTYLKEYTLAYFIEMRIFLCSVILGHLFFNTWARAIVPQGPGAGMIYLVGMGETILLSIGFGILLYIRK